MNYRQKQKSLLIDPSNLLTFNVSHEHIHMKKIKTGSISNSRNQSADDLQPHPDESIAINTKIYYSVVEKESESGISFNDRLFFLRDQDAIGYMSKPDKNFDIKNAKQAIQIKCLRRVTPKGKTLTLEFEVKSSKDSSKMIEKKWLLRMRDKKMADAWTDIINYQVGQIPSRKSTMQRHDSRATPASTQRKEEMQTAQKTTNYFSKMEEPIANERPQQQYLYEGQKNSNEMKTPRSMVVTESKEISESPVRDEYSNSSNEKVELSPEQLAKKTYDRQQECEFNSTSERHSQKKERYMSSGIKLYRTSEFAGQNDYYQEIQATFRQKNLETRQKLILPSFYNYFRPYLDNLPEKRSSSARLELDKKYQDFITFCELTAKQLIDKTDTLLHEFKLSSRFACQKDSLPHDKLFKEIAVTYQHIFGKPVPQTMEVEAMLLLFENIIYLSLEDTELIVPLAELKTLPAASDSQIDQSTSLNKICENSLIAQFQAKQRNLQYIYSQISKDEMLKDIVLIPMSCQLEYKGFTMFFCSKINQTLLKAASVYDSSREISYIANVTSNNQNRELTIDEIYEHLAQALYVNGEVLESQNHFQIKSIRTNANHSDKVLAHELKDYKHIINFADILPYLEAKQVIDASIFVKVHHNGKMPSFTLAKSAQNSQTSRKTNPINQQETQFLPSVLKSQSIYKKKQNQKLPLYNQLGSAKQNDIQLRLYKQEMKQRVKAVANKLDRFDVSIVHPYEINEILKVSSLNHTALGKIYNEISGKNEFVKLLIKSEIAAQCTKMVLFKKCQQLMLANRQARQKSSEDASMRNITTLLNLILGKSSTKQTQMIWKVLTLHAQLLYSVSVSQQELHKGYFILALSSKLNFLINPNSSLIEDVFNHDKFILTVKFQSCKISPIQLSQSLMNEIQEICPAQLTKNANSYFKRLDQAFSIASSPIPYFIKRSKHIYNKILLILAQKISPNNLNFNHLNIYETRQLNFTQIPGSFSLIQQPRTVQTATSLIKEKQISLKRQLWEDNFSMYFKRKLKELQYKAVERNSFNLEQQTQVLMKEVKVFYDYHPLISEFLEFLSDYHFTKGQHQRAIDCLKASLSNIISVCEGNSNHVKLAHCFLKVAIIYERVGKFEECLNQLKRSKHCLEINKEDKNSLFAYLMIKIAKVSLQMDGKLQQALSYLFTAEKTLQTENNLHDSVQMIIDAYETEFKCLCSQQFDITSLKSGQKLDRAARSMHYFETLERILIKENQIAKNRSNQLELIDAQKLQRFFKLVLPHYFHQISQKGGQMFMIYMCELSQNIAKRDGIDFTKPQLSALQKAQTERTQQIKTNLEPQFFVYPLSTNRSNPQQDQKDPKIPKQPKQQYNFFEAFFYLKKQISNGSFILELSEFMEKTEEILSIIKRKIKQNLRSKSQSQSSSRMYLMSTKGADEWDAVMNGEIPVESNKKSRKSSSGVRQDEEEMDLEKLLEYSKQVRSSSYDGGYSERQRKFDSLMKALMVLLGDGFMLHIFEE